MQNKRMSNRLDLLEFDLGTNEDAEFLKNFISKKENEKENTEPAKESNVNFFKCLSRICIKPELKELFAELSLKDN